MISSFAPLNFDFSDLALEDLKRLIVATVPPHEQVKQLVGVPVNFLELAYGIQFLFDDLAGTAECYIFRDSDFELLEAYADGGLTYAQVTGNFRLAQTLSGKLL